MITRRVTTAVLITATFGIGIAREASAALVQKLSDDFAYKYEFGENQNPTDPAQVDLDGNTAADWNVEGSAPTYPEGEGVMRISTVPTYADSMLASGTSTNLWHNLGLTMDDSFSIEFRSQVVESVEGKTTFSMVIRPAAGAEIGACQFWLNVGPSITKVDVPGGSKTLDECDNSNGFHVFRVAKEIGNVWWIWRDGVLLNEEAVAAPSTPHGIRFLFGDPGTGQNGKSDHDYLRIDEAAFSPVPFMPGDANFDRKVDADDAAILAGNWLKAEGSQWGDGDFNRDGKVDDADAALMAANWLKGVNPSAAVPEPSVMITIVGGLIALVLFYGRKAV